MNSSVIIGLDAAQAGVRYHFEDRGGRVLATGFATKTRSGWTQLQQILKANGFTARDCLAAIEATGHHHLPWCELFVQEGAQVLALNPLVAKRTTSPKNAIRDYKSDAIDAEGLTRTARREGAELERFSYHSDPEGLGLRSLLSARRALRAALTNLKKHAGTLQELIFPGWRALKLPEALARALQAKLPEDLAKMDPQSWTKLAGAHAERVKQAASETLCVPSLALAVIPALQGLIEAEEGLNKEIKALDRQIARQSKKAIPLAQLELARSLPGFGAITTPVVLANLPNAVLSRNEPRKRKVACLQAHFGLDPRLRQSGQWKGKVKLSKRGDSAARTALYQISSCSLVHDPEMYAYYQRLRTEQKKSHKQALIDLSRKHLRRLVAVLSSGQPYQPQTKLSAA